jgi:hypothetical protein
LLWTAVRRAEYFLLLQTANFDLAEGATTLFTLLLRTMITITITILVKRVVAFKILMLLCIL